jgi:hypothetical protein
MTDALPAEYVALRDALICRAVDIGRYNGHSSVSAVMGVTDEARVALDSFVAGLVRQIDDLTVETVQIYGLPNLKARAEECSKKDYCSCGPCEMSYCVTQRFVEEIERDRAQLTAAQAELVEAQRELREARAALGKYGQHGYYCDYARRSLVQQPCTCGLEAALKGEQS